MARLVEEIWKIVWYSLLAVTLVIGLLRYRDKNDWWKTGFQTNSKKYEYEKEALVYYSVKGAVPEQETQAELFVKNISQENTGGEYGVFENIFPGQIISIKITQRNQSIRSPAFRLQEGEIKHLFFELKENNLVYLGSRSRLRKIFLPETTFFGQKEENNLFVLDILKENIRSQLY